MKKTILSYMLLLLLLTGCALPEPTAPPAPTVPQVTEPSPAAVPPETEQVPAETEAPEPTEPPPTEDPVVAEAERVLDRLTPEEKVAQLFFITPEAFLEGYTDRASIVGPLTEAAFAQYPVGGILYMGENLRTPEQTEAMLSDMQRLSRERLGLPIFLGVDEEGGTVARISGREAFGIPALPDMAEVGDPAWAGELGAQIGQTLFALGFNVDFAPVADVLVNPDNTVVRRRSFGSDPALVSECCAALSDGLQAQGVLPCYKHFPGHGATAQDSHDGYASSDRTLDELLACELLPFFDAAERGVPFIMCGHITLPNVTGDGLPASLSRELVTGLLRERLGYQGLILTDALSMGAITKYYSPDEAALLAFEAGSDLLLLSEGFFSAYNAILEAVREGRISEARLNDSVRRILQTKLRWQAAG